MADRDWAEALAPGGRINRLTVGKFPGQILGEEKWHNGRMAVQYLGNTYYSFPEDGAFFAIAYFGPIGSKPTLLTAPMWGDNGEFPNLPDLENAGEVCVCEGTDTESPEEWCARINAFFNTDFQPSSFAGR